MDLGIDVKSGEIPVEGADIRLRQGRSKISMRGSSANFTGLEPGIYMLSVNAEGYYGQALMIGLKNSGRLEIMLRERK